MLGTSKVEREDIGQHGMEVSDAMTLARELARYRRPGMFLRYYIVAA